MSVATRMLLLSLLFVPAACGEDTFSLGALEGTYVPVENCPVHVSGSKVSASCSQRIVANDEGEFNGEATLAASFTLTDSRVEGDLVYETRGEDRCYATGVCSITLSGAGAKSAGRQGETGPAAALAGSWEGWYEYKRSCTRILRSDAPHWCEYEHEENEREVREVYTFGVELFGSLGSITWKPEGDSRGTSVSVEIGDTMLKVDGDVVIRR